MRTTPFRVVAWWVWYRGAGFRGYQSQQGHRTVQAELMRAFAEAGLERNPVVAGRTDRGVSARMQVLSSRVREDVPLAPLRELVNARLPEDLQVHLVRPATDDFSAAWSASGKEYRYLVSEPGDLGLLSTAAAAIPGTRDFRVFHYKTSALKPRTVEQVELLPAGHGVTLRFVGEGFARFMVRMLVGGLLAVSRGEVPLEVFQRGLVQQQNFHCPKAPPEPLVLWNVRYPGAVDPFDATDRAGFPAELERALTGPGDAGGVKKATT